MRILAHLWVLGLFAVPTEVTAQPDNAAVYQNLVQQFILAKGKKFRTITAEPLVSPLFLPDSTSNRVLQVFPLQLTYSRLRKGIFLRQAQARFQVQDSTMSAHSFAYSDTLSTLQLQQVRRASPDKLKGDNPQLFSKWGIPILTVAGSIGVLVGLFFARSG